MIKKMTAGVLKKILENVPDETVVLVPGSDHSYRTIFDKEVVYSSAELVDKFDYSEWFGSPQCGGEEVKALILP